MEEDLANLEIKIKRLIQTNKSLKRLLEESRSENQQLKEEIKRKEEELYNFQNRYKISKIVGHVAVDGSTAELKSKINEYIKEIDKCIAHLSA